MDKASMILQPQLDQAAMAVCDQMANAYAIYDRAIKEGFKEAQAMQFVTHWMLVLMPQFAPKNKDDE